MPRKLTPEQRAMRASIAAHVQWAKESDPTARTQAARDGFMRRFEVEADPDDVLEPAERARRAEHLRRAYFTKLALASSRARKKGGDDGRAA
jgi:hypothetical protein